MRRDTANENTGSLGLARANGIVSSTGGDLENLGGNRATKDPSEEPVHPRDPEAELRPMQPATQSGARQVGARSTALLVIVLSVLWLTFSGKFDALHLAYGALSIGLVVLLTRSLVVAHRDPSQNQALSRMSVSRALVYPWWLVVQIIIANVQVTWIIIRPNMDLDPVLITFRTGMTSALAKVTLGNSIILTPGTFTLRIVDDRFLVHSIHESLAASLLDGTLQRKVGALFGEQIPEDLQIVVLRDSAAVQEEVERWSS